jgi:hypothetical protein
MQADCVPIRCGLKDRADRARRTPPSGTGEPPHRPPAC